MPGNFSIELADGPGRPVVLSHALGLDHTMWLAWAATQSGRRPVLAYDTRGHGRSLAPQGTSTMQDLVGDAARVLERWQRGPVVWVGLSMGGMVGQGLAIRRRGLVHALVLAHTVARYPDAARQAWAQRIEAVTEGGMAAIVDTVVARYLNEDYRARHPAAGASLRAQLLANDPQAYAACCRAVADVDWLDQLHRIACPTLVLAGALDVGASPALAMAMHERIAGSHFVLFDDASHLSPIERPEAFSTTLEAFLESVDNT